MSARQQSNTPPVGTPMPVSWQVVSQTQTTQFAPDGRFVPGVNVTWKTDNGVTGTTFIPDALYNLDNVLKAVARHVEQMLRVHFATGTVHIV